MTVDHKAIREALDKATPGPWIYNGNEVVAVAKPRFGIAGAMSEDDCMLIANAPEWIRQLLDEIKALDEENETLMQKLVEAHTLRGETMIQNQQLLDENQNQKAWLKNAEAKEKHYDELRQMFNDLEKVNLAQAKEIECLNKALDRIGFYCAGTEFKHVSDFVLHIKRGGQID